MASTVRHFGAAAAATPFPTLERRSIAVNTWTRQLAVGDEAAGSVGAPIPLIAVRYFSATAAYVINDYVIQNGLIYRAPGTIAAGAFNASQWTVMDNSGSVLLDGSRAMTGNLTLLNSTPSNALHAASKGYVDSALSAAPYVEIVGDTMTGALNLPAANPTAATQAAHKSYVDTTTVSLAGDTMTGDLTINAVTPRLTLDTAIANYNVIAGKKGGLNRWEMYLGTGGTEPGGNAGSDFALMPLADAGSPSTTGGVCFTIARATGKVDIRGPLQVGTSLAVGLAAPLQDQMVSTNTLAGFTVGMNCYYSTSPAGFKGMFSGAAAGYFAAVSTGVNFNVTGAAVTAGSGLPSVWTWQFNTSGGLVCPGGLSASTVASLGMCAVGNGAAGATAVIYLNGPATATGGGILHYAAAGTSKWYLGQRSGILGDGSDDFMLYNVGIGDVFTVTKSTSHVLFRSDIETAGYYGRAGVGGAVSAQPWNWYWTGTQLDGYVQTSKVGTLGVASDYRIKKDVVDLPNTWDIVKALRPIKYTQAEFNPPSEIARRVKEAADIKEKLAKGEQVEPKPTEGPMFTADDVERWGFIAHELQATMIETAATGVKDSFDTVQSPNPWTIIAALTKTLQEAMARIEALEATGAPVTARRR